MALSIFMTVLNTVQASPDSRILSFVLTAGFCTIMVATVCLTVRAAQGRQNR